MSELVVVWLLIEVISFLVGLFVILGILRIIDKVKEKQDKCQHTPTDAQNAEKNSNTFRE